MVKNGTKRLAPEMVKNGTKTPNVRTPKSSRGPRSGPRSGPHSGPRASIHTYAVQCEACFKWRTVSSQEEFEEIRSKHTEDPFFCNKKPNMSCEDPADIEYDSSRTWVMDKPNLPKTPTGFQREVVMRRDFSKMDVHYVTPQGKRIRASTEISSLLKEHPEYQLSISDFSFTSPKVMGDTIPGYAEKKGSTSGTNKLETSPVVPIN